MILTRSTELLTKRLQQIITRDSIIIIHLVITVAALLDTFYIKDGTFLTRAIIYTLLVLFFIVGIIRLVNSGKKNNPLFSIVAYQILGTVVVAYLAEIHSFWPVVWLIPFYLSGLYYSRKVLYLAFVWFAVSLALQLLIQQRYIVNFGDYLYVLAEFLVICSLGLILRDSLEVTKEDRELLLESLDKSETEEKRLYSLINSITDGVIAVNVNLTIYAYNSGVLNLLNTHEDLNNKLLPDVLKIYELYGSSLSIADLLAGPSYQEVSISYSDGEKAILGISVIILRGANEDSTKGYLLILRDITKQKDLEYERDSFVSLMSHELRTPLTIAEGNVSNAETLISKGSSAADIKQLLTNVHNNINELIALANEFSLLADSNKAGIKPGVDEIDIDRMFKKLRQQFQSQCDSKGLTLKIERLPEAPPTIKTSLFYLEHILSTLLGNALQFTSSGSIQLLLSNKPKDELAFAVIDTGVGIPKSDQSNIFKPFFQSQEYATRSIGGVGLGLYTAKRLGVLMGANLSFKSELNKGSTFSLTFKLKGARNLRGNVLLN